MINSLAIYKNSLIPIALLLSLALYITLISVPNATIEHKYESIKNAIQLFLIGATLVTFTLKSLFEFSERRNLIKQRKRLEIIEQAIELAQSDD